MSNGMITIDTGIKEEERDTSNDIIVIDRS